MRPRKMSKSKRFLWAMLAFWGPIAIGAFTIKAGGYVAFWFLCYFLMLMIPVAIIVYLIYKYIFQIAAEKVEDRFEDEGKEFLSALQERYSIIGEAVWDRTFYNRSRLSPRKPFDRLALLVSEDWFHLSGEQKKKLMEDIYRDVRTWVDNNDWKKNDYLVRVDFYNNVKQWSLLGHCADGRSILKPEA